MVKVTVAATSALMLTSSVSAYNIYNTNILNCRVGPSSDTDRVRTYTMGMNIIIECQIQGQLAFDTDIWDLTQDGCYVLDYYVYTGYSQIFKPLCGDGSSSSNSTTNDNSPHPSSSGSEKLVDNQSSSDAQEESDDDVETPDSDTASEKSDSEESENPSSGASHTRASLVASMLTAGAAAGYALSLF